MLQVNMTQNVLILVGIQCGFDIPPSWVLKVFSSRSCKFFVQVQGWV